MAKQTGTSRVRIDLTEAQKERIRQATGRVVDRLELRRQGWPDPAADQESAADSESPVPIDPRAAPEERKTK
jgi:hypothetical protein